MIGNKTVFKYETPFKGPYEIVQTLRNRTVTLQTVAITTRVKSCDVKTYKKKIEEASIFSCRKR